MTNPAFNLLRGERIGVEGNASKFLLDDGLTSGLLRGERIGVEGNAFGWDNRGYFDYLLRGERIGVGGNHPLKH